jgi:hypothetical protein
MVILFTQKHADNKAVVKVIASTRCRNLSQTLSLMTSFVCEQCASWMMMSATFRLCEGVAVWLVVFLVFLVSGVEADFAARFGGWRS